MPLVDAVVIHHFDFSPQDVAKGNDVGLRKASQVARVNLETQMLGLDVYLAATRNRMEAAVKAEERKHE